MKSGKPGNCDTGSALQPGEPGDCLSAIQHTRKKLLKNVYYVMILMQPPFYLVNYNLCHAQLLYRLNLIYKINHCVSMAVTFILGIVGKKTIEIISTVAIIKTDIHSSLLMHFTSLKCQIRLIFKT